MKRLLIALAVLWASAASAAASLVSIHLDSVPLPQLAALVFGEVLGANYVLDSSMLARPELVTVHMEIGKSADSEKARLIALVESFGVEVAQVKGVYFVKPRGKGDAVEEEAFFYRPRYRSVDYLVSMLTGVFKHGRFTHRRGIQATGAKYSNGVSAAADTSDSVSSSSVDSGGSAYSMIDKEPADSFIFVGSAKDVARLSALLEKVDVDAGEVFVRAQVYEVTTSKSEGSGFGVALSLLSGKLGLNLAKPSTLTNSLSFKSPSVDAVFSVFAQDSRFKSLSAPALRVKSGYSARISVGSDVPVLGSVQLDKNGNPVQSVTYRPSGVILDLSPEIREGAVDLTVNQTVSSFTATTTGVNNSPTLLKRELKTRIGAQADDVIVLGGMDEAKDNEDESGPSFLPSFLKTKGAGNSRTELLLVLQVQRI